MISRTAVCAFSRERERLAQTRDDKRNRKRVELLSVREREVLDQLLLGLHNRDVGERLGISPRTVEVHKARILEKLRARNVVDLIRQLSKP